MLEKNFQFPILIGDIGGTNARFSLIFEDGRPAQIFPQGLVKDYKNIDDMLENCVLPMAECRPQSLILAIAGPVKGEDIALTNCGWRIRPKQLIEKFSFASVFLMNDFEAQALATTILSDQYLYPLAEQGQAFNKEQICKGTRLILGPGTGLGVAALLHVNEYFIPVAGEGGHVDYAPQSELDFALYPYLQHGKKRLSAEEILSGRGLYTLYKAFCQKDGLTLLYHSPDEVSMAAFSGDKSALESLSFFWQYLARLAGDLALVFKAEGGVYIGGGIMPNMIDLIEISHFRALFSQKFPHESLLANIPIFIMNHPHAALEGITAFARRPEKFIMEKEGHLWQKNSLSLKERV